nr:NADH dehydrogenase subunit 6 [Brachytarsina amboinensis]
MIQLILISSMLSINLLFMFMKHPLSMGLMLLIQTLMISIIMGTMMKTYWISYMLFLVFVGGLLVMFMYIISLASNELFKFSFQLMMFIMMIFMLILLILNKYNFMNNFNNLETQIFSNNFIINENSMFLFKLYNMPNNLMTIMLMNYLLITLIATVKITKNHKGPLRMMN